MDDAFAWVIQTRGGYITGENDYPYVSGAGQVPSCSASGTPRRAQIVSYHDLPHNENDMATWMAANGPISIGVDASSWQSYTGGVLTNCVSQQVDHGVLAVGFDDNHNPPYWKVKNSWAASWGEAGYIRVQKGTNACLITTAPSSSKASRGPAPPPGPTPPTPPSPPSPSSGTFTQYVCDDFLCIDGCAGHTFQQGVCLSMTGGGSAIAQCGSVLTLNVFSSSDCSGSAQQEQQPIDSCTQDQDGTYIYNTCNNGNSQHAKSERTVRRIKKN